MPAISTELAEATCLALELTASGKISADIVGLDRHGVIAVAKDPWTAFEHIERLEHICQIVLVSGVIKNAFQRYCLLIIVWLIQFNISRIYVF